MYRGEEAQSIVVFPPKNRKIVGPFLFRLTGKKHGTIVVGQSGRKWDGCYPPMFRGSFEHTIDEKGRVSIPSKFREILKGLNDDRLVATKFILNAHRCLDVYPQASWDRFEEELRGKPSFDATFLKLETFYVSNAQDCIVDKQGRILLPPVLRDYAGLKKDVVFAGVRDKFRIWDKEAWQKINEEAERDLTEKPDSFNILSANVH